MKSLEELAAIREKMQSKVLLREGGEKTRVVVGMATCGIAAGARPVLNAFVSEVAEKDLEGTVMVGQTGCIGMCRFEPIVEIFDKDGARTTYIKVHPDMVGEIVEKHLIEGKPVAKYTIGAAENNGGKE